MYYFLQRFLALLKRSDLDYFIFEYKWRIWVTTVAFSIWSLGQLSHARMLSYLDALHLIYEVLQLIPLPSYSKTVSINP